MAEANNGYTWNKMTILIVEDNREILCNISEYLEAKKYSVDTAQDGLTALHLLATNTYELVVLDVMLPGVDGIEICQRLRNDLKLSIPVLMLTARDALEDRLLGFKSGADDYLIKPFSLAELQARIEAILRRSDGSTFSVLCVGDLKLDSKEIMVSRGNFPIVLNRIGFRILEVLMKSSPSVLRRNELEEKIWGHDIPESDTLRTHIHQLRQAIDKPFDTKLIHTVHGVGYCVKELL